MHNGGGMRKVFGFGETVLDIIFKDGRPVAAKPGGSVLNAFVSLGRLGWNPFFISEYGRDDVGCLIEAYLRDNGVDTRYVNRYTGGKSALALAFLDPDNNASYSFYKDFPEKRLQVLPGGLKRDDIILFGSIYASSPEVGDAVHRFMKGGRSSGCLIVYDPNFRKAHLAELDEMKPRILKNIEYADIIRGSDEDFRLIFGLDDPGRVAKQILSPSKILLYTRNSGGVLAFHKSGSLEVPAEKIEPVSTIGAGDTFNAGILHFLLKNRITRKAIAEIAEDDLRKMAEMGVKLATHVCLHYDNYISREFAGLLARE